MRKRRVIIVGSDPGLAGKLSMFFEARGYETAVFREPAICPVSRQNERCPGSLSCGDIAVIRHDAPSLNAVDLLAAQQRSGCGLAAENKAVIASSLDQGERAVLAALGATFFPLPFDLRTLGDWVAEREKRMDLGRPVAIRRKEERLGPGNDRLSLLLPGAEVEKIDLVNRSDCGVCFRTSRRFTRNQMMKVRLYPDGTTEDAVVRWTRPVDNGSYLVGLSYCA
jgi:hypothetical protein